MKQVFCGLLLALTLCSSCAYTKSLKYRSYPKNPFPDIETVAVFPFINGTSSAIDTVETANTFATEMVKFEGFKVVRPSKVMAAMEKVTITSLDDVIALGRDLKADAVLVATVTDYDPYNPPRIAVALQLFRVQQRPLAAADIDRIVQSATWKPFKVTSKHASNLVASFERVYDSNRKDVKAEVEAYAMAHDDRDYAFKDGDAFLNITSRYWQFVSCRLVMEIIDSAGNVLSTPEAKRE